jgi:hypothetical protein
LCISCQDKAARKKKGIPEPPEPEGVVLEAVFDEPHPEGWMFEGFMAFVLFGKCATGGCKFNTPSARF